MKQILSARWFPAVAPFVVYSAMTFVEGQFPGEFILLYSIKLIATVVTIAAIHRVARRQERFFGEPPRSGDIAVALAAGLAFGLAWIPIDGWTHHFAFLGHRVAFDPLTSIASPIGKILFLVLRFSGLTLVVPYVEELFYRGFLLRAVTEPDDWNRSAVGRFSASALALNIVFFALSHPEWLAAALFAGAMCYLTYRSKGLAAPMIAHGLANLVLGTVILHTGGWKYW